MREKNTIKASVGDKRTAILYATLQLIAERGFHNTPMSMIAKESGVSTGIIYHYFENKDELIYELYREIKLELLRASMRDYSEESSYRERFLGIWNNRIRYHMSQPEKTIFLIQFENSPYSKPALQEFFMEEIEQIIEFVKQGVEEGVIKDLPFEVGAELTFGIAISLAKQHHAGVINLEDELIQKTANACWDAISRKYFFQVNRLNIQSIIKI